MNKSATVTVCSACLQASCWKGIFFCDDYMHAGTVERTVEELRALGLEHPSYFERAAQQPTETTR